MKRPTIAAIVEALDRHAALIQTKDPPKRPLLAHVDLSGMDLSDLVFDLAVLEGVSFRGAKLQRVRISGVTGTSLDFAGADLTDARAQDMRLAGCDFSGVRGDRLDLSGSHVKGCCFDAATLASSRWYKVECSDSRLNNAELLESDFTRASFRDTLMRGVDLSRAEVLKTMFHRCDLRGARLRSLTMDRAIISECKLSDLDWRDTTFVRGVAEGNDFSEAGDGSNVRDGFQN